VTKRTQAHSTEPSDTAFELRKKLSRIKVDELELHNTRLGLVIQDGDFARRSIKLFPEFLSNMPRVAKAPDEEDMLRIETGHLIANIIADQVPTRLE
jgi:hypothetical protein